MKTRILRSERYPDVAKEWSVKNRCEIDSSELRPTERVLWVCLKGHEWYTLLKNRLKKNPPGCPYCTGRFCLPEYSLLALYPALAKQFIDAGNTEDPNRIVPGSAKKYTWLCPNGHIYNASPLSLIKSTSGCPTCDSFGFKHPELLNQWDHENNQYDPFMIHAGSNKKIWWKCEQGHSWEAVLNSRTKQGTGCSYCLGKMATPEYNFAKANPEKAKFWDYEKNPDSPTDLTPSANKKRFFVCEAGHCFKAKLNNIHNGKWCPYCANKKVGYGNSLADTNPALAKEWNPNRNKFDPTDVVAGSTKKVWWICAEGHEWQATISARSANEIDRESGNGCPYCAGRVAGYGKSLGDLYPELAKEIDPIKNELDPFLIPAGTGRSIWWVCPRGHSYQAPVVRRTYSGSGCRFCSSQTSLPEIRLYAELQSIFPSVKSREKVEGLDWIRLIQSSS